MNTTAEKSDNISPSTTGPVPTSDPGPDKGLWPTIKEQAPKDPHAQALLELKQSLNDEIQELKQEREKFEQRLQKYQENLKRVDNLLLGVVVVVSLAFISTLALISFDAIKEKDLYLQNNNLYQGYLEQSVILKDQINEQKIEILNLKNKIQRIYDKNSYLK